MGSYINMPTGIYKRTEYHRMINRLSRVGIHKPAGERFEKHILNRGNKCWLTDFSKDRRGYARFHIWLGYKNLKPVLAHRFAYEYFTGTKIPLGMCVLHHCDNPSCINPTHLYVGTKGDNGLDMRKRKRVEGSKNGYAKLTEDKVLEIRSIYPKLSYTKLAKKYNVSISNIEHIIQRTRWDHI